MSDPTTVIAADGAPALAIDVLPDVLPNAFVVDDDLVDGPKLLGWGSGVAGDWRNVVCNVRRVRTRRGATRLQGVLTRTEAGEAAFELEDLERTFDPMVNGDAIHAGVPLRVRAWGTAPEPTPVEVRRNLAPNPRLTTGSTGWGSFAGTGGAGTGARSATGGPDGGPYWSHTWSTASTGVGGVTYAPATVGQRIDVAPGQALAVSADLWTNAARGLRLRIEWRTAAGAAVAGSIEGASTTMTASTWQRLTAAGVAPATTAYAIVTGYTTAGAPIGAVVRMTRLAAVVDAAATGDYFDGSTASDDTRYEGALGYSWAGTADASASIERETQLVDTPFDETLMTGRIGGDLAASYQRAGAPIVTFTAVDLVGPLARWSSAGRATEVGAGDTLRGRVFRLLTEMGRDPNALIDGDSDLTYVATLRGHKLARGWEAMSEAVDAELGRLWVNRLDKLVVRARGSAFSGPLRGTFSDWHGDTYDELVPHCCYVDAEVRFGTELLMNRAIAARRIESGEPASIVWQVDDSVSQARYDEIATVERRSLELAGDGEVFPWARYVVSQQSTPELRVDSVTVAPWSAGAAAWRAVVRTDIGDRWAFRLHPELGPTVSRGLAVLGIVHEVTPEGWSTTFTTVDATEPTEGNPTGYLIVGDSAVDSGDLLYPWL